MPVSRLSSLAPAIISLALAITVALASSASAQPLPPPASPSLARASVAWGNGPVLARSVAVAIKRARTSLTAAARSIHTKATASAIKSLKALQVNIASARTAAVKQMKAPAGASDTPPGVIAVVAVLTFDQTVIKTLAPLYDAKTGRIVIALTSALVATMNARADLLDTVVRLNPDGAGGDYDDSMSDTSPGYTAETAKIKSVLAKSKLSPAGKAALQTALKRSKAAAATFNKRFGGGE